VISKQNIMFHKFEYFDSIADKATRQKLANTIFDAIQKANGRSIGLSNEATENFTTAIDTILANDTMRGLCQKDPILAEKVT
jgi:hypothetical protein